MKHSQAEPGNERRIPILMGEIGTLVGADLRVCPLFGRTRRCAPIKRMSLL